MQVCAGVQPSVLFDIYPGMQLMGHRVMVWLTFGETARMFFKVVTPSSIPASSVWVSSHSHAKTCYSGCCFGHLSQYELISHCVLICNLLMTSSVENLHKCIGYF